jgi:hypothetical protein
MTDSGTGFDCLLCLVWTNWWQGRDCDREITYGIKIQNIAQKEAYKAFQIGLLLESDSEPGSDKKSIPER